MSNPDSLVETIRQCLFGYGISEEEKTLVSNHIAQAIRERWPCMQDSHYYSIWSIQNNRWECRCGSTEEGGK
jgi:hypothetical protein